MILTEAQQAILKRITAARNAERDAKRDALERAKAIARAEIGGYLMATDLEIRRAHEAGIAAARIGQALGTSDARTVTTRLAHTAQLVDVRQPDDDALADRRYSVDAEGVLTVALTGDELLKAVELEEWTHAEAQAAGVTTATFRVGHYTLEPLDKGLVNGKKHPIQAWAVRNEDPIVAWFHARQAADS